MKKLLTTLFVLAAISTAAIAETKLLSVNFAIPFDNINKTIANTAGNSTTTTPSTTNYTSIGFGVTGLSMFNKIVGIYTDVEFGFVQSQKIGDTTTNRNGIYGNNGSQFSMDFLLGPAFRIIETKNIFFSAAPVIHLFMNTYSYGSSSYLAGFFGLGADVSFSFFITKMIGLTAGFDFAYDFLGFGDFGKTTTGNYITTTTSYSNIKCTPKLGLTFRFQ
jgi:hypothetical protein